MLEIKELENMVKDDVLREKASLRGLEETQSTMKENMQLLENDIIKYESAIRTLEEKRTTGDELAQKIDDLQNFIVKVFPHLLGDFEKKNEDL